jgi:O-antigen/teichoic acid export membrane protein
LSEGTPEAKYGAVGAIYGIVPIFFVLALCLCGGLTIVSSLLLGPQYRTATAYLPWFMLGGAFNGVYLCTAVLYFHNSKTRLLATISFLSGLVGATATWGLVAVLDVNGAAIAYAFSQALLALATTIVAMRTFELPWKQPRQALTIWFGSIKIPRRFGLTGARED